MEWIQRKPYPLWLALFFIIFLALAAIQIHKPRDGAPLVYDQAEVHNIAWNLIHGRGYSFDWDDPAWRALYLAHSRPSMFREMILTRTGAHTTLSRPPLMPLLVVITSTLWPAHPFMAWRLLDCAFLSSAICLLTFAVQKTFGDLAAAIVLALALLDPLRIAYVPGWWTEGIAFDFMAAIVWLMVCGRSQLGRGAPLVSGIVLGLLCLDRTFFVLLLPVLALLLAAYSAPPKTSWLRHLAVAAFIFGICLLLQLPWAIRNIRLAHEFLPLGTQGGFNLPDEYSDHAVKMRGLWDGDGIGWAWTTRPGAPPDDLAVRVTPAVGRLRPAHHRAAIALHAFVCESLKSEIAVADLGSRSAAEWIKSHLHQLPKLFLMKIVTQIDYNRKWMICLTIAGAVALFKCPQRRITVGLVLLCAVYIAGIGMTHVMSQRFLVPILPPLYALAAAGIACLIPIRSPTAPAPDTAAPAR